MMKATYKPTLSQRRWREDDYPAYQKRSVRLPSHTGF